MRWLMYPTKSQLLARRVVATEATSALDLGSRRPERCENDADENQANTEQIPPVRAVLSEDHARNSRTTTLA